MISIIAAIAENGVIGRDNTLPWKLPADLQYFKKITMGHPIIMGRKNHEDIGRPLPGRQNIILTRDSTYQANGCTVVNSVEQAVHAAEQEEIFIIGGAEIYRLFLPVADRLYITQIHQEVEGNVYFPKFDLKDWRLVSSEEHLADESNPMDYSFIVYDRSKKIKKAQIAP
jgi:dihydrofolate reductase